MEVEITSTSSSFTNTTNATNVEDFETYDDYPTRVFLEVLTVFSILCLIADVLIIFVIIKYTRLRQNKQNILLLHWTIVNAIYLLFTPTTIRLATDFDLIRFSAKFYCILNEFEDTLILLNVLLVVALVIYWFMSVHFPVKFEILQNNFNFMILFVYVFAALSLVIDTEACISDRFYEITTIVSFLLYLVFIAFMLVVNIVHYIKQRRIVQYGSKTNVALILGNTFVLSWLPLLLYVALAPVFVTYNYIVFFLIIVGILNPVYNIVILYLYNNDFHVFLRQAIRCKCFEYENDELSEQPVVYNNQNEEPRSDEGAGQIVNNVDSNKF